MRSLLVSVILLLATPAWAFNTFQLMDPGFQRFVVVEVPLAATLLMGLLDTALLYALLRPSVKPGLLLFRMVRANLLMLYMNLAVMALLAFWITGVMTQTEYQLPILFAVGYFMLAFAGFAWWKKVKLVGLPAAMKRRVQVILGLTTIAGYGVLYCVIYMRMFAYPG